MRIEEKHAEIASVLTHPVVITALTFAILDISILESSIKTFMIFITSITFSSVIPMLSIFLWGKLRGVDVDIPDRMERLSMLLTSTASYFAGFFVLYYLGSPSLISSLMLCYTINTLVAVIISMYWKISLHVMTAASAFVAITIALGPIGLVAFLMIPVVAWCRLRIKRHTLGQTVAGALLGIVLTIIELFIFVQIL